MQAFIGMQMTDWHNYGLVVIFAFLCMISVDRL